MPPLEWHGARVKRLECVGMGLGDEEKRGRERESKREHKADAMLWIESSAVWNLQVECECELAQATRGNTIDIFHVSACASERVCVCVCVHSVQGKRMRVLNMTHGMHSENVTSSKVARANKI